MADLNRDAAHANQTLSPIFDREKEQQRLQQAQLIGEIGNQVADIARTEGQIAGEKAKRDPAALNQARAELEAAGKPFTEQDVAQRAYNNGMAASGFGTGGKYQQAIQAATAAVQGLAGGNLSAALAGGAAPYIAEIIKQTTPDGAGRVAAHAVVNAALAVAQGNNALAGAAGAATGEVVGMIATQMYGKPVSELSETEKQTVSTLATVAAGLAGGLAGDSGASAVAGAQSGKTTVENNSLANVLAAANKQKPGTLENYASGTQAAIKEACSGNTPVSCQLAVAATGSVMAWPLLPEAAALTSLIGAGANAGVGLLINGEVNPDDVILGYWTGAFTAGTGLWGTMAVNAGSGATSSYLKGDDPLKGGLISGAASGLGYGAGKLVELPFDKVLNPMKPWKDWLWTDVGMGISKPLPINPVPGVAGNITGSVTTEYGNDQAGKATEGQK
ncbi:VENN motif pre-toxin domain-containing protein [Escherichia coli]|nr:VENN motif pre-toxin domain-containing protein [Escherichia coli]